MLSRYSEEPFNLGLSLEVFFLVDFSADLPVGRHRRIIVSPPAKVRQHVSEIKHLELPHHAVYESLVFVHSRDEEIFCCVHDEITLVGAYQFHHPLNLAIVAV